MSTRVGACRHSGQGLQDDEKIVFTAMSDVVAKCYADLKDNAIMRDLVKWYLIGAEKVKTKALSDEEWVVWICEGCSNSYGNSFGEKHKADPLITLANLPPMAKFKPFLLSKYKKLVQNHKFKILKYNWDRCGFNSTK